jgi:hypothetical protein
MPMPGYSRFMPIFLLLASAPTPAHAQDFEIQRRPATLRIAGARQESERLMARLSGRIVLTIQIAGPKTLEVEPNERFSASADWEVEQVKEVAQEQEPAHPKTWRESFVLRPVKPGALYVPLQPLRYRERPSSSWQLVKWPAVIIHVTTEILNPNPNDLYDQLLPEEPPKAATWWKGAFAALLAAALVVSLAGTWVLLGRRRAPKPDPVPDALTELERVARLPLENPEQIEHFHSRLSEVLRTFLQQALDLPVTKRTTAELLAQISDGCSHKNRLTEILGTCDLVKFAGMRPNAQACHAVIDAARALIVELSLDVAQKRVGQQENGSVG